MTAEWRITQKPDFYKALVEVPPKEMHQIIEKVNLLAQDPTPDGKVKRQLKYMHGRLHRIRSGDYRIFYTFEYPYISILALRRRDDDTYDEDVDVEFLGGLDAELGSVAKATQPDWEQLLATKKPEKRPLPEPITGELLTNLRVPEECHARLLRIQTEEDLLDCPGVPEDYLLKIDEYMFERPLVQVLQQPDYLLNDVNDLLRYKEGELMGFLLKLSPEQEKYGRALPRALHCAGAAQEARRRVSRSLHHVYQRARQIFAAALAPVARRRCAFRGGDDGG